MSAEHITTEGLRKAAVTLADQFLPRRAGIIAIALIGFVDACTITLSLGGPYFVPFGLIVSVSSRFAARRTSKEE